MARFPLDGGRIVTLIRSDPNYRSKKANEIRALMDSEVGWNDSDNIKHRNETVSEVKIIGCIALMLSFRCTFTLQAPTKWLGAWWWRV